MEIPPLRRPRLKCILVRSILDRTLHVAGRALLVAAPAGALLWVMGNTALLDRFCDFLDPLGKILGMNGKILASFFLSFPANELFLPIMLNTLGISAEGALLTSGISNPTVLSIMLFMIFHWPCATTVLTIFKETGSMKKTAVAVLLPTATGMLLCFMINLLF
jgi:ferrous iron transport protein B